MSQRTDTERRLDAYLAPEADRLPDRVLDAALADVARTPQRRALRVPWRCMQMTNSMRAAAAIAIVAIVGVGALAYIARTPGSGGPPKASPTPSPVIAATATPTDGAAATQRPRIDVSQWIPYTSEQYGFVIGYPEDWTFDPATRAWDLEADAADWLSPAMDDFVSANGDVRASVWTMAIAPEVIPTWATIEVERWYEEVYCPKTGSTSCAGIHDWAVPLCLEVRDCHPGILLASPKVDTQALFASADTMHFVTIWRSETDPSTLPYGGTRRLLEAFLSTMNVWPADNLPAFEDQFWPPTPPAPSP